MRILAVIGPTGIGKTSFSLQLAQKYNTEILSCDSRQFYKEMNIGTAKPSISELALVPHHFINSLSIQQEYSAGDFERDSLELIEKLSSKYRELVVVGGSMLFEKALTEGLDHFPEVDKNIRKELNTLYETEGIEPLQNKLKKLDPEYYLKVDKSNPHRLIRALEICEGTSKKYSSFLNSEKPKRPFEVVKIGIQSERQWLYDRINKRVEIMKEEGLTKEVESLLPFKDLNALQTIGYQELFRFFEGDFTEEQAYEEIKKNTRRYAKRQLTWYRKDESIQWVSHENIPEYLANI